MTPRSPDRALNKSNWDPSFALRLSLLTVFGEVRDVKYCNVVEKLAAFYTLWRQIIDSISFERQTRIWSFLQCFCRKFIWFIWICLALKLLSTNTWSKSYRKIHVIKNEELWKTQIPPIDISVGGNHYTTKWQVRKYQPSPPIFLSSIFQTEYLDIAAWGPISFTFKQYIWGPLEQRQLMSRTLFEIQQSNALKYQNLIVQSALGFIISIGYLLRWLFSSNNGQRLYDFPNHTIVTYHFALSTHPKGSFEFWPSSIFIPRKTSTNPILCILALHC